MVTTTNSLIARVSTSSGADREIHPLLERAMCIAAEAAGASDARLLSVGESDQVTNGTPLGVDGLALVLAGARPRELGLLDCAGRLVRQAWTWSAVACSSGSAAGRARRSNFVSWLSEKVRAAMLDGSQLSLLMLEVEDRDPVTRMYGGTELEDRVPLLYNAVERTVRGIDSVYRCDDVALAVVLPRCDSLNAGKVVGRIRNALEELTSAARRPSSVAVSVRTYNFPDELTAFVTGIREEDLLADGQTALLNLWCGMLAGTFQATVVAVGADQNGQLTRPLAAIGIDAPSELPRVAEEAFLSGSTAVIPRAAAGENTYVYLPASADSTTTGLFVLQSVHGAFGPAELEVGKRVAGGIGHLLAGAAPKVSATVGATTRSYRNHYDGIIGQSPAMHAVFELLERVVETDYPAIIQGESGTGKELVARAIHFNGQRRDKPLIAENCAALNDNLLEAELFGYEKGSFTGAETSRKGLFELADGGTLFLDEVADMRSSMQKDLLRILQEGIVRPVGSKKFLRVDVRIICASNRNLATLVDEGKFRADLYYRLNVWNIQMPALRERRTDIPELIEHFLDKISQQTQTARKTPARGVLEAMSGHDWPGNIRELKNEIARMVALSSTDEILLRDFSKRSSGDTPRGHLHRSEEVQPLAEVEKLHILRTLRFTNGNRARAAELLGINKATIYRKLKTYGMDD